MSKRGLFVRKLPDQISEDAWFATKQTIPLVQYSMDEGRNGGVGPDLEFWSTWETPKATMHTSDCIGFALPMAGFDRFMMGRFARYGGWMNTNSLWQAAINQDCWAGSHIKVCEILKKPQPGALVLYPSYKKKVPIPHKDPHHGYVIRTIPGHIGVCLDAKKGEVAHCHGPPLKGDAVTIGSIDQWLKHKYAGKDAIIVRLNYPT